MLKRMIIVFQTCKPGVNDEKGVKEEWEAPTL